MLHPSFPNHSPIISHPPPDAVRAFTTEKNTGETTRPAQPSTHASHTTEQGAHIVWTSTFFLDVLWCTVFDLPKCAWNARITQSGVKTCTKIVSQHRI